MALTLRQTKGSELSHAEMDANFAGLGDGTLVTIDRNLAGGTTSSLKNWIAGQVLNVKTDFGAVGDGVTDDTTAITNAIAALGTNGGVLVFPAGTFITDTIQFPQYPAQIYFIGSGREATTLQALSSNKSIFQGATGVVAAQGTSRNFVYGFTLKAHASGSTGAAMNLAICDYSKFQNIGFALNGAGAWTYGVLLDGTTASFSNEFDDFLIVNATPCTSAVFRIENVANLNIIRRLKVISSSCPACISFDNTATQQIIIEKGHFEGLTSTSPGVIAPGTAAGNIIVRDCYFENVVDAIDRSATATVFLYDNFFAASPGASIAGAWPKTFASINNNTSGGTNARNAILGRPNIYGANGEHGGITLFNSTAASSALMEFDGTNVTLNWPFALTTTSMKVQNSTATPAGGTSGAGISIGSVGIMILWGSGAPTASATKGSLYLRTDGTTTTSRAYINTDGATTWTAITTSA